MNGIDQTKLKRALDRLLVATETGFPWSVRMQLMAEATIEMCQSQIEVSAAALRILRDIESEIARVRKAVEEYTT